MKRQSRRAAVRAALRRGKPLRALGYREATPPKRSYSCRRGRCEHYDWCDAHRYEQFPCETAKEEES